jgi:hypothetical protein
MNDFGAMPERSKTIKPIAARLGHLLIIGLMLPLCSPGWRRSIQLAAAHTDTDGLLHCAGPG